MSSGKARSLLWADGDDNCDEPRTSTAALGLSFTAWLGVVASENENTSSLNCTTRAWIDNNLRLEYFVSYLLLEFV